MDNAIIIEKIEKHEKDIEDLKCWKQGMEIYNVKNKYELKELITLAVLDGQKEALQQILKINERLDILEDEKKNKALEEQEQRKKDVKENKKFIRTTITACVISSFITLLITFFGTIILSNLTESTTFQKKLENYNKGQEVINNVQIK